MLVSWGGEAVGCDERQRGDGGEGEDVAGGALLDGGESEAGAGGGGKDREGWEGYGCEVVGYALGELVDGVGRCEDGEGRFLTVSRPRVNVPTNFRPLIGHTILEGCLMSQANGDIYIVNGQSGGGETARCCSSQRKDCVLKLEARAGDCFRKRQRRLCGVDRRAM